MATTLTSTESITTIESNHHKKNKRNTRQQGRSINKRVGENTAERLEAITNSGVQLSKFQEAQ